MRWKEKTVQTPNDGEWRRFFSLWPRKVIDTWVWLEMIERRAGRPFFSSIYGRWSFNWEYRLPVQS